VNAFECVRVNELNVLKLLAITVLLMGSFDGIGAQVVDVGLTSTLMPIRLPPTPPLHKN